MVRPHCRLHMIDMHMSESRIKSVVHTSSLASRPFPFKIKNVYSVTTLCSKFDHALDQLLDFSNSSSTNSLKIITIRFLPVIPHNTHFEYINMKVSQAHNTTETTSIIGTSPEHHALYQHSRYKVNQAQGEKENQVCSQCAWADVHFPKGTNISILARTACDVMYSYSDI